MRRSKSQMLKALIHMRKTLAIATRNSEEQNDLTLLKTSVDVLEWSLGKENEFGDALKVLLKVRGE